VICLDPKVKRVTKLREMSDPMKDVLREVLIFQGPMDVYTDEFHLRTENVDVAGGEKRDPKFYVETPEGQILVFAIPNSRGMLVGWGQTGVTFKGRFACMSVLSNFSHHRGLARTRLLEVVDAASERGRELRATKLDKRPPLVENGKMWHVVMGCMDNTPTVEKARKWVQSGRTWFPEPRFGSNNLHLYCFDVDENSNPLHRNDLQTAWWLRKADCGEIVYRNPDPSEAAQNLKCIVGVKPTDEDANDASNRCVLTYDNLTDASLSLIAAIVVHATWKTKPPRQLEMLLSDELALLESCVAFQDRYYEGRYAVADTLADFEFDSRVPTEVYAQNGRYLSHWGKHYWRRKDMVLDDPIRMIISANGRYYPLAE
jgi:hypothetical protein